ncbi:tetratricopeptide repeat protein [Limnofasciculus baicalensis]|uniref:tetratricopeptide repeat protein n=1 Tax=Limnofasciculus baicalensis TaxID=3064906 RepID=UPI0020A711C0|nr:tetratricopeptide repeat protein [Limnofasciculus baicalensis]
MSLPKWNAPNKPTTMDSSPIFLSYINHKIKIILIPLLTAILTQACNNHAIAKSFQEEGLEKAGAGDYQGAIEEFNEAIHLDGNFADAYFYRGYARSQVGDKQGALADYNELIRLKPDKPLGYNNRCSIRIQLKDYQNAIADCDRAINLAPNLALGYQTRGLLNYNLGDREGAIADFQTGAELWRQQGNMDNYRRMMEHIKRLEAGASPLPKAEDSNNP